MANGVFNPSVPDKSNDILLGEGIVWKNYGVAGAAIIGATRGGSKLTLERKIRDINFDGAYGSVKGLRRFETYKVKLAVNFLKITYTSLSYGLSLTTSAITDVDGSFNKTTFNLDFDSADVLSNVAFVGQKNDGKACIIIVENALNIDNIELDFKEKDELTTELVYTGFYTYAAPTTPPIKILDYV